MKLKLNKIWRNRAEYAVLSISIGLTALFAYKSWNVVLPPWEYALDQLKVMTDKSFYITSIGELLRFQGGYLKNLYGLLVYISMSTLILSIGHGWIKVLFDHKIYKIDHPLKHRLIIIPIAWALGAATVSLIWFVLATAGLISSRIAFGLGLTGFGIGLFHFHALWKEWKENAEHRSIFTVIAEWSIVERSILLFLTVWCLIWALNAFYPELWTDALVYHLGLPAYYIANQEFVPTPYSILSYLSQNAQMIYMWGLLMKSEVAIKLINWTFLVMTSLLLFGVVEKKANRFCGLMAVLLLLMMPMIIVQSTNISNDLQTAFYLLTGWVLCLLYLTESKKSLSKQDGYKMLFISGCCFGAAFGTKYYALCVILLSFVCILFLLFRRQNRRVLFSFMTSWFIGILLFSTPWLVRTYYYTGNPIYPFQQQIFKRPYIKDWHSPKGFAEDENSVSDQMYVNKPQKTRPNSLVLSSYSEYFKHVIGTVPGTTLYQVGWILGIFLVAVLCFIYKNNIFAQLTCLLGLGSWFLLSQIVLRPRFHLASIVLLIIPFGISLSAFTRNKAARISIILTLFSALFFHGTVTNLVYKGLTAFVITATGIKLGKFTFKSHSSPNLRTVELIEMSDFAKSVVGLDEKVLLVGLTHPYRFESPFVYSSPMDVQFIDESLEFCETGDDLRDYLLKNKINYILIDPQAWRDYLNTTISKMTQDKLNIMSTFFSNFTKALSKTENLIFFSLKS